VATMTMMMVNVSSTTMMNPCSETKSVWKHVCTSMLKSVMELIKRV